MSVVLSEQALPISSLGHYPHLNLAQPGCYKLVIPTPELSNHPTSESRNHGHKQFINLRHGLNLLIRDYWLQDVLVEENLPYAAGLALEFGFNLSVENDILDGTPGHAHCFLQFDQVKTLANIQEWLPQRCLKVDLHLSTLGSDHQFTEDQLALIPSELHPTLQEREPDWCQSLGVITPAMQLVLQQILNCPYQGSIQQIYLEGKALELIALQTAQFLQLDQLTPPRQHLKRSDVERIYQAKDIVSHRLDNPPSLLDLARSVGLNDCTLKRGFRQIFGITVFGYIRQQRLSQARQLLLNQELSIAEVACTVGYSHPGHFSIAFKREFGISPKAFSRSGGGLKNSV